MSLVCKPRWAPVLLCAVAGWCTLRCGPVGPDQLTDTRWVRYHHWADEVPCADATEHLDALVDFVAARFAFTPRRIDYYKERESQVAAVRSLCGGAHGASACAPGTDAYTTGWAHDHEVIHALFDPLGHPPLLFMEGIAEVLGCGRIGFRGAPIDTGVDFERLISSQAWFDDYDANAARNYAAAGSLVRYLLDTYGNASFRSFYATAPDEGDQGTREAFRQAFGVSYEKALAAWRARGPSFAGDFCVLQSDPCQGPPQLGPMTVRDLVRPLSCLGAFAAIDPEPEGAVAVGATSSTEPITVVTRECDPTSAYEGESVIAPEVFGELNTSTRNLRTPGRELELRLLGLKSRVLMEFHAAGPTDIFGPGDPEASPAGAPTREGELRLRQLGEPAGLFSAPCDGGELPISANAWAVHLSADSSAIPPGGGMVRLHADTPMKVLTWGTIDLGDTSFCPAGCQPLGDGGCALFPEGAQTDFAVSMVGVPDAGPHRFSFEMVVSP